MGEGGSEDSFAHVELAAVYSQLGHDNEAWAEVAEILRVSPDLSPESFRRRLPYKNSSVLEQLLAALRKAGLK